MKWRLALLLSILSFASWCFACIAPPYDTTHPMLTSWAPNSTVAVVNDPVNPVPFTSLQRSLLITGAANLPH